MIIVSKWSSLSEDRDHAKKLESAVKKCETETTLWSKAADKK